MRNADVPAERRIEFRIGINLGDIISRSSATSTATASMSPHGSKRSAEPGGICVSRVVRDQVRDKLDFAFDDRGEQQVKNIARPVRVFDVRIAGEDATPAPDPPARASLALPDKPSIAVLPFTNMSGDPEQEYFADGMVEDIITALVADQMAVRDRAQLDLRLQGQARSTSSRSAASSACATCSKAACAKSGNRVRVTGQLIDTASGTHVWAERYDRALDDIFALQDELTMSVIGAIEPTLRQAEIERAKRKRPDSLDAYDPYPARSPLAFTAMPEFMDQALPLLQQAVAIEPDYALAHAYIAWCNEIRHLRGGLHDETRAAGLRHAHLAIATGGDDATALAVAAFVIGILEQDYSDRFQRLRPGNGAEPVLGASVLVSASIIRAWAGDSRDFGRARRNRDPFSARSIR